MYSYRTVHCTAILLYKVQLYYCTMYCYSTVQCSVIVLYNVQKKCCSMYCYSTVQCTSIIVYNVQVQYNLQLQFSIANLVRRLVKGVYCIGYIPNREKKDIT